MGVNTYIEEEEEEDTESLEGKISIASFRSKQETHTIRDAYKLEIFLKSL